MSRSLSSYQFNAPDADTILLSGELECPTEFHVHRFILSAASPFFQDMFGLPQPSTLLKSKPVIPVSEHSDVLDTLLRFVYPVPDPIISSLDELVPVLAAALKYDLSYPTSAVRQLLISPRFVSTAPIRVYAIACRFDLDDEAKIASRHTLSVNILDAPLCDDLKHITAYSYHRLLDLHRKRGAAAIRLLKIPDNIKCMQCNGSAFTMHGSPKWWWEFERMAKEELTVRPCSDVIFGMEFLDRAACESKCPRCSGSILDSWRFLMELKAAIDALPATI
ncbi:hypothetical protein BDQ12DRAFT_695932 [Crucibulum laeve]|uniref:BTB domain-containing protein n=1 Tax=Crucibulum laeve TaxID=68775 RepID=A0A5C3MH12_9AGAR|nr:hypothetical protein BDQ12DRAFT_695932 [Crucibulum laeve]